MNMDSNLFRALQILATCKPEILAESTYFTVEACREAIATAQLKVQEERAKRRHRP